LLSLAFYNTFITLTDISQPIIDNKSS